jgi:hypothetical protein
MYRVIGADYKEYGPIDANQVRQWIIERRLNSTSLIQPEGCTGWQPLSSIADFAAVLAQVAPVAVPLSQPGAAAPGLNAMAVTGVICSSVAIFCCLCGPLFAVLGIVFSVVGLSQINQNPAQRGKEIAIAGIVLGAVALLEYGVLSFAGTFGSFWQHLR